MACTQSCCEFLKGILKRRERIMTTKGPAWYKKKKLHGIRTKDLIVSS